MVPEQSAKILSEPNELKKFEKSFRAIFTRKLTRVLEAGSVKKPQYSEAFLAQLKANEGED